MEILSSRGSRCAFSAPPLLHCSPQISISISSPFSYESSQRDHEYLYHLQQHETIVASNQYNYLQFEHLPKLPQTITNRAYPLQVARWQEQRMANNDQHNGGATTSDSFMEQLVVSLLPRLSYMGLMGCLTVLYCLHMLGVEHTQLEETCMTHETSHSLT